MTFKHLETVCKSMTIMSKLFIYLQHTQHNLQNQAGNIWNIILVLDS